MEFYQIFYTFAGNNKIWNYEYLTMYLPPFTRTAEAVSLIAEISAKIERYTIRLDQSDGLLLRKANRIKADLGKSIDGIDKVIKSLINENL